MANVLLITGGGRGIGAATAKLAAARGFDVAVTFKTDAGAAAEVVAALKAKGDLVPTGLEELAIKTTYVRDVMRRDVLTVRDVASFDEVMDLLANHRGDTLYVLDQHGALTGIIQLQDVKNFINDPSLRSVVIASDLTRPAISITPEDSLATVMPRFDDSDLGELSVVATGTKQLIGRLRQQDVIAGIRSEVLGQHRRARFQDNKGKVSNLVVLPSGWELATLEVPEEWHGLSIDNLPAEALAWLAPVLVTMQVPNNRDLRVPATQELVLHAGQELLALCRTEDLQLWRKEPRH
ncbi:MAG: SDR family NAD(P)-dependent oxidoreductase [Planctomycetota bacterium]